MYAEDPDNNFFPSPGKILDCRVPTGPGIRLDEGIYAGWTVPNEYDPMLGKLIAWGGDRREAIARMGRALEEYYASGIKTNVSLFRRILASADFQKGAIYTRWLDDFLSAEAATESRDGGEQEAQSRARCSDRRFSVAHIAIGRCEHFHDDRRGRIPVEIREPAGTSKSRAAAMTSTREPERSHCEIAD